MFPINVKEAMFNDPENFIIEFGWKSLIPFMDPKKLEEIEIWEVSEYIKSKFSKKQLDIVKFLKFETELYKQIRQLEVVFSINLMFCKSKFDKFKVDSTKNKIFLFEYTFKLLRLKLIFLSKIKNETLKIFLILLLKPTLLLAKSEKSMRNYHFG